MMSYVSISQIVTFNTLHCVGQVRSHRAAGTNRDMGTGPHQVLPGTDAKPALLKFLYSEKAKKYCEISTTDLSYLVPVIYTVEILQIFVAFSEYV